MSHIRLHVSVQTGAGNYSNSYWLQFLTIWLKRIYGYDIILVVVGWN